MRRKSFWTDESGPTAVEYGILLALIIVVSMGTIGTFGTHLYGMYVTISGSLL